MKKVYTIRHRQTEADTGGPYLIEYDHYDVMLDGVVLDTFSREGSAKAFINMKTQWGKNLNIKINKLLSKKEKLEKELILLNDKIKSLDKKLES